MEIINEVKEKESKSDDKKEKQKFVARNMAEVQKAKLDKLMKNPEKLVIIPERRDKDFTYAAPPSFVRNVMGSSAGAGSGEFHVYRHLRRKEFARQKGIQERSRREELDEEYHKKLEANKKNADAKTAKNRAKRLKRKEKAKLASKKPKLNEKTSSGNEGPSDSSSDDEKGNQPDTEQPESESEAKLAEPPQPESEDYKETKDTETSQPDVEECKDDTKT